ncbi:antitoxin Xre/MbcA/ParS toxin-binding domain-containing protein [Cognatilysobacter lacus]|uniref:DUF2384 domain-containing protein n=1 Tax=Cognatilysobacter lacus TaxID=1643323 RepID=A0A5D8ZA99_9GAMM|nr:antitoxin Xre/MbcA/ParS toxin-binding domain-containing protein [Lysobacter lacus]TZF91052.1 DUF2384 domain-containing protein [Lysobacter lacus]
MTIQHSEALDVARGNARHSTEALALDARRAARGLGVGAEELGDTLDVGPDIANAILAGSARIAPGSDLAERALLLVRLHRALGDVHGSVERMHDWLHADEPDLQGRPRELIRTTHGLRRVVTHIESHCKDCLY